MKGKRVKKALAELKRASLVLSQACATSSADDGEGGSVPIHQLAHGAAAGLGMAAVMIEDVMSGGEVSDSETVVRAAISSAIDWEREHPELMSEGGGTDE